MLLKLNTFEKMMERKPIQKVKAPPPPPDMFLGGQPGSLYGAVGGGQPGSPYGAVGGQGQLLPIQHSPAHAPQSEAVTSLVRFIC